MIVTAWAFTVDAEVAPRYVRETILLRGHNIGRPFVWFSLMRLRDGGGSTAAAVTLDIVGDRYSNKMAEGVAMSPSRLCSRDGNIACDGDALSTIFLLACYCALLPTFRFSFLPFLLFLHPEMLIFFVSLRLCSSHLLLSARTYYIVRVFSACVICTLPHLGILLFVDFFV